MVSRSALEKRIVILAPIGRDSVLLASSLSQLQVERAIAPDAAALLQLFDDGAGCGLIAEEALEPCALRAMASWLADQPAWSDIPLIILTFSGKVTRESDRRSEELQTLGNVTLVERPSRPETIRSSVRSALRARARQYEIRTRQDALVQANADLEGFAHSASHDLREPLRSMSLYSEFLVRNYSKSLDQEGIGFLRLMQSAARRMDTLLDDLLSYARASSIPEGEVEPVPSRRALEAALENLASAIRDSKANIEVGEMPAVRMRESHLALIFQNLIGNALKYRAPNQQIDVRLSGTEVNDQWLFSIADNGIGIPAEYHETIFGMFRRLHSNSTYTGTGMGLAICKRIVEKYGGRIWVESESGRGAKFLFSIPA